jgi:signal transduction histidine kinase/CheY-like chemotaxis protein
MQVSKEKIWQKILYFGVTPSMKSKTVRKAVQMNIISLITFLSFHIFYIALIIVSNAGKQKIFISYSIILSIALFSLISSYFKNKLLTKVLIMLDAFLGIFFFDVYLGSSVSMGVYYFPFLFVTIKIFSFKREKLLLVLFILLPLILNILSGTIFKNHYDINLLTSQSVRNLRTFNFTFAFFLVVVYANYIINSEIKNETITENARISLQTLIDNTNGSLWSIDNNYEIIAANKLFVNSMKKAFGVTIEAGYNFKKLMYSEKFPQEWLLFLESALNANKITREYKIGEVVHEIQVAPIMKNNREVMGAAFHDVNINVRKQYEKNIEIANEEIQKAVKSKEQFLSNMSHELRTPLNGIIGISNILLAEKKLESQHENLDMLKYSADHMLDIVNDILDYNKIDAKKVELENTAFDITTLINKVAIFFNQQAIDKGIKLVVDTNDVKDLIVTGDALRLRQILNNLIGNAIKFTNEGTVSIIAKKINDNNGIAKINFTISDTGIGIENEKLNLIFSSFVQADNNITKQYGGTGLGLTISARLVELMDSKINVESIYGVGSKFSFELDLSISNSTNLLQIKPNDLNAFDGVKALIAEDNKVNLMVLKRFLNNWGIHTSCVENGQLAIEMARANKFDLILMDLNMPEMDGKTATQHIRTFDRNIPIIAITASTGDNLKNELLGYGINDYLPKPFMPDVLHSIISKMIIK